MLACLSGIPVFYGWLIETVVSIIAYVTGFAAWFAHQNKKVALIAFLAAFITAGYGFYPFSSWLTQESLTPEGACITTVHLAMIQLLHIFISGTSAILALALLVNMYRNKGSR